MLMRDCITYRLDNKESIRYIKSYTGIEFSESWIKQKRKQVENNAELKSWINEHTRIGFVRNHRQLINEMEKVQRRLFQELLLIKDVKIVMALTDRIIEANKRISELNLGMPVIAQMKKKLEEQDGEAATGDKITAK